ncbi:MAG: hypothetical protein LBI36_01420 [Oscillospiraceae bacterium]|jgi:hypothetical protein|nr:hypothetical protein [Oscillospiraceae bacterium]
MKIDDINDKSKPEYNYAKAGKGKRRGKTVLPAKICDKLYAEFSELAGRKIPNPAIELYENLTAAQMCIVHTPEGQKPKSNRPEVQAILDADDDERLRLLEECKRQAVLFGGKPEADSISLYCKFTGFKPAEKNSFLNGLGDGIFEELEYLKGKSIPNPANIFKTANEEAAKVIDEVDKRNKSGNPDEPKETPKSTTDIPAPRLL